MVGGEIKVVMTLDDRDFTVKTVKAGETINEFTRNTERARNSLARTEDRFKSFGSSAKELLFAISLVRYAFHDLNDIVLSVPTAFLKAGGEFERMTKLMEGLSKETDKTKRQLEALSNTRYVINLALSSPFNIKSIQDSFVKFKSAGLDPTNGSLKALVDSVAKFGGTDEQLKRASVAIQQMAGKGVISMEELRQQLGEAVPDAMQLMAEGTGLSMAKLTKLVSQGQVEATSALDRMFTIMSIRNRGAAQEMMSTWTGITSRLATQWELFKNQVASSGGENSFLKETSRAVTELDKALSSPQMKQFAYNIGTGLAEAVRTVTSFATSLSGVADSLKTAGIVLLSYFGAQRLISMRENFAAMTLEAKRLARETSVPQNKGGLFQNIIEGSERARIETAKMVEEQKRGAQELIAVNQRRLADNQRAISGLVVAERRAQAEQIVGAAKELELTKAKAAEKSRLASLTTQQAGQMYAEAVRTEKMIQAIDESGKARQGRKRAVFVENMNAYRQETVALQQKAVALRQEAAAELAAAEAKYASTRASKEYLTTANQKIGILQGVNANLQNNIQGITNHAAATIKATVASRAFQGVVRGFGSVFQFFGGWVGLAITALALATDKLMHFMDRWKRADEFRRSVMDGVASEEGITKATEDLKTNQGSLSRANTSISNAQGRIENLQARKQDPLSNNRNIDRQIEEERAGLEKLIAARDELAKKVNSQEKMISRGKELVMRDNADRNGRYYEQISNEALDKQILKNQEIDKRLKEELEKVKADAKTKNPKISPDQLDALTEPLSDKIRKNLVDQNNTLIAGWTASRDYIKGQIQKTTDETAKANLTGMLVKANENIAQLKNLNTDKLGTVELMNAKGAGGAALGVQKFEEEESPLFKLLKREQADFAKAQMGFDELNAEAKNFVGSEQNKALVELLGKLAAGDFDSTTSKNRPGVEPGKKQGRNDWIAKFQEFVAAGKGTAEDFIQTLDGLDVSLRANEKSVKDMFKAYVEDAGAKASFEQKTKAMQRLAEKQAGITEELTAAQEQFNAGVNYLPTGLVTLQKELAQLSAKLQLNTKDFAEFEAAKRRALSDKMTTELTKESIDLDKKAKDAKLANIVNVREREAAIHRESMDDIEKGYQAQREEIIKINRFSTEAAAQLALLDRNTAAKREQENQRYTKASKTELDKIAEGWADTFGNIDSMVASSAKTWMDEIENFVTTGSFSFKKLLTSFLTDMAKVSTQKAFGGLVQSGASAAGGLLKGLLGDKSASKSAPGEKKEGGFLDSILGIFGGKSDQASQALPIDPATGAVRMIQVTSATAVGGLLGKGKDGEKDPVKEMWDQAKDKASEMFASVKSQFSETWTSVSSSLGGTFDSLTSGLGDIFSGMGDGLSGMLDSIMGMFSGAGGGGGGGGGGWGEAIGAIASSFFAKGGIMSSAGSLPLKMYANGGVANSPQMAIFGEGRMNEAYVPLPDGRSIPVTMSGQPPAGTVNSVVINIAVTGGKESAESKGDQSTGAEGADWKEMAATIKTIVLKELGNQKRPGGMLTG